MKRDKTNNKKILHKKIIKTKNNQSNLFNNNDTIPYLLFFI